MILPFHSSAPVVDGYVRKPDGSIDHARTKNLAKALKWHPGDGMSPEEARQMNGSKSSDGKSDKKNKGKW
jgi:hypothetical protein